MPVDGVELTATQVSHYLNKNAWRYLEALKIIKGFFDDFRFSEEGGRTVIYSIYSRGERQRGGDELKEAWKVKEKVNKMRTEGIPKKIRPLFQRSTHYEKISSRSNI